jgi:hypothetical protein
MVRVVKKVTGNRLRYQIEVEIRLLSKVAEIVPVGKILATEPYTDIR